MMVVDMARADCRNYGVDVATHAPGRAAALFEDYILRARVALAEIADGNLPENPNDVACNEWVALTGTLAGDDTRMVTNHCPVCEGNANAPRGGE